MTRGDTLLLKVTDFKNPQHWRWLLADSQGKFLQDFEVDLDSSDPNYQAFLDLYSFLEAHSSPDKWLDDQVKLIKQVGAWISKVALGHVVERIASSTCPSQSGL
jgi:hypothetical protein